MYTASLLETPSSVELVVVRAQATAEVASSAVAPQGRRNISRAQVLELLKGREQPVLLEAIVKEMQADKECLKVRLRRMVQEGLLQPHSVGRNGRLAYTVKVTYSNGGCS